MLLSKKELLTVLGINSATFTGYINDGMGGRVGSGAATKYDVKSVFDFHVVRMVETALKQKSSARDQSDLGDIPDKETSDAIIAHWKAKREEARTLKEIGDLIPIETANREIQHRLTQVRNSLDAIPGGWAPFVVGLTSLEHAQRTLSDQLQSMYTTLSSLPDVDDDEDEPNDPIDIETEDDA